MRAGYLNMIDKIRVYDMDGTIVCSMHRYRTKIDDNGERIDLEYWRENEHKALYDSLLPLAEQYKADLENPSVFTVIATARVLRDADMQFIKGTLGEPDYIISRPQEFNGSGAKMKLAGLRKLLNLKQFSKIKDIIFYEDNVNYLKTVCDNLGIMGVYIPSRQGH
jgi:hypothetical protein